MSVRSADLGADLGEAAPAHANPIASRDDFRTLADSIPQLTWIADGLGHVFWYNRRWYDYTGMTLEEMAGWGWRAVHHPDHLDAVVERFKTAIAAGDAWEDTFPLRAADGEYRWFLSRALPQRDGDGRVVRWFGTNTDVTEQREADEALRRSEARFPHVGGRCGRHHLVDDRGRHAAAATGWLDPLHRAERRGAGRHRLAGGGPSG